MGVVRTILLVAFVIVCVLLVLLVLIQNDDSNGMGSIFGGGNSAAFGSHSASVLTKTTGVLAALFFVLAFTLALLTKAPAQSDLSAAAEAVQSSQETESASGAGDWLDQELNGSNNEDTDFVQSLSAGGQEQ